MSERVVETQKGPTVTLLLKSHCTYKQGLGRNIAIQTHYTCLGRYWNCKGFDSVLWTAISWTMAFWSVGSTARSKITTRSFITCVKITQQWVGARESQHWVTSWVNFNPTDFSQYRFRMTERVSNSPHPHYSVSMQSCFPLQVTSWIF